MTFCLKDFTPDFCQMATKFSEIVKELTKDTNQVQILRDQLSTMPQLKEQIETKISDLRQKIHKKRGKLSRISKNGRTFSKNQKDLRRIRWEFRLYQIKKNNLKNKKEEIAQLIQKYEEKVYMDQKQSEMFKLMKIFCNKKQEENSHQQRGGAVINNPISYQMLTIPQMMKLYKKNNDNMVQTLQKMKQNFRNRPGDNL